MNQDVAPEIVIQLRFLGSFETAKRAITGMETMRLIQKGQVKYISKGNVRAQNEFINKLFNIAA